MGKYDRKDRYYQKAKDEGHASRAYYKLEQIQQKYKVIRKGDRVVDLGCAPGGWLEIVAKIVGNEGLVLGIDLLLVQAGNRLNVIFLQGDVCDPTIEEIIDEKVGEADVVLSDMAPATSGIKFRDSYLSYELASRASVIAQGVLKIGGNFVVKIFPGEEFAGFKKELMKFFKTVHQHRPPATRNTSIEIYLIGLGYKGQ